jgi:hypothetical protein
MTETHISVADRGTGGATAAPMPPATAMGIPSGSTEETVDVVSAQEASGTDSLNLLNEAAANLENRPVYAHPASKNFNPNLKEKYLPDFMTGYKARLAATMQYNQLITTYQQKSKETNAAVKELSSDLEQLKTEHAPRRKGIILAQLQENNSPHISDLKNTTLQERILAHSPLAIAIAEERQADGAASSQPDPIASIQKQSRDKTDALEARTTEITRTLSTYNQRLKDLKGEGQIFTYCHQLWNRRSIAAVNEEKAVLEGQLEDINQQIQCFNAHKEKITQYKEKLNHEAEQSAGAIIASFTTRQALNSDEKEIKDSLKCKAQETLQHHTGALRGKILAEAEESATEIAQDVKEQVAHQTQSTHSLTLPIATTLGWLRDRARLLCRGQNSIGTFEAAKAFYNKGESFRKQAKESFQAIVGTKSIYTVRERYEVFRARENMNLLPNNSLEYNSSDDERKPDSVIEGGLKVITQEETEDKRQTADISSKAALAKQQYEHAQDLRTRLNETQNNKTLTRFLECTNTYLSGYSGLRTSGATRKKAFVDYLFGHIDSSKLKLSNEKTLITGFVTNNKDIMIEIKAFLQAEDNQITEDNPLSVLNTENKQKLTQLKKLLLKKYKTNTPQPPLANRPTDIGPYDRSSLGRSSVDTVRYSEVRCSEIRPCLQPESRAGSPTSPEELDEILHNLGGL